ncbi:hypothetical protein ACFL35_09375 [Candidatus Riflebacteria bacterium]
MVIKYKTPVIEKQALLSPREAKVLFDNKMDIGIIDVGILEKLALLRNKSLNISMNWAELTSKFRKFEDRIIRDSLAILEAKGLITTSFTDNSEIKITFPEFGR